MSGDGRSGARRGGSQRAIPRPDVPPGPLGDLKALVYELYLQAGKPRLGQFEALYELYLDAGSPSPGPTRKWAGNAGQPGAPGRDTVARIIGGTALPPSQADLLTVVAVLARAARWDPDDAVARARGLWVAARMARPAGLPLSEVCDPFALEVHRPVEVEGAAGLDPLPPYVPRGHDAELASLAEAAAVGASGFAVLVGDSSTGKTRACWETLGSLRLAGGWRLWHPIAPSRPEALLEGLTGVGPRTVVWLNEAQEYLGGADGERVAAELRQLLRGPGPVLVLGTLWRSHWDELTRRPAGGPDPHAQARELLSGRDIPVPAAFTPAELSLLARAGDARLDAAAQAADGRAAQFLAGAPELLARYRNAPPAARALIDAAMDGRRLGAGEALSLAFLEAAAPGYLDDTEWGEAAAAGDWLERALAYAAAPCKGTSGPLTPIRLRPGTSTEAAGAGAGPACRLADYLDQHGRRARSGVMVPASFWDAAAGCASLGGARSLARAALDRDLLRYAAMFNKRAALLGETGAAAGLVMSLHRMHPGDDTPARWAAAHASLGNPAAVAGLLDALRTAGAGAHVAALVARDPAAHASLDDPRAVGSLIAVLQAAGAGGQAEVLVERAVGHVPLEDPDAVGYLVGVLRGAGAGGQVAALVAGGHAAHASMEDPGTLGPLLNALSARDLAVYFPLHAPPTTAGSFLKALAVFGVDRHALALVAQDPAAHVLLENPGSAGFLLDVLLEAGEGGQAEILAERAAAQASLEDPGAVGRLLGSLQATGDGRWAAVLTARDPASHVSLGDQDGVAKLLNALQLTGEDGQAAALRSRLSSAGLFRVLEAANLAGRLEFGRGPDGSPAGPWGWTDLG